jgi:hypothetical protein
MMNESKVPPERLYHAAPVRIRERILRSGLDFRASRAKPKCYQSQREWQGAFRPLGNYFYEDSWSARDFADRWIKGDYEVWVVASSGLALLPDPEPVGKAWYTAEPVAVANLLGIEWSKDLQIPETGLWFSEELGVGV